MRFLIFIFPLVFMATASGNAAFFLPASAYMQFDNTVKNWSESERAPQNVNASFEEWFRCFSSRDPSCLLCNQSSPLTPQVTDLSIFGANRCLPSRIDSQVAYSEDLSVLNIRRRDAAICACFANQDGPSIMERASYQGGIGNVDIQRNISGFIEESRRESFQRELTENLRQERRHTAISAMNLVNDGQDAAELAARYTNPQTSQAVAGGITAAAGGLVGANVGTAPALMTAARQAVESQPLTAQELNADVTPPGYCLPYRSFVASEQFPVDPRFYEALDRMNGSFRAEDWNYNTIVNRIAQIHRGAGGIGRPEREEIMILGSRLHFLQNNPIMRNIFLAGPSQAKIQQALFDKIREMPRPACTNGAPVCERSGDWMNRLNGFRDQMAEFFRTDGPIAAAQEGSGVYSLIASNVATLNSIPDVIDSNFALQPDPTDPSKWGAFCQRRGPLVQQLEQFDIELNVMNSPLLPQRDFVSPEMDEEYNIVNEAMCTRSTSPNGAPVNFKDYLARKCPNPQRRGCGPENRQALIDEFFRTYRHLANPKNEVVLNLVRPFFNGEVPLATVDANQAAQFNTIARSPELRSEPVVFRSSGAVENRVLARSDSSAATVRTTTTAQVQQPLQNNPQGSTGFAAADAFVPSVTPQGSTVVPEARVSSQQLREELARGESEAQVIRDQIAGMRSDLDRRPASKEDSSEVRDLNARLDSLRNRLTQQEQRNRDLQTRAREAEAREAQTERVAERRAPRVDTQGTVFQGGAQIANPQSVSGSGAAPSIAGLGGVATLGAPSAASSVRGGSRAGAALLDSKYAGQGSSEQGGITVSDSPASSEYQALREQSGSNVVNLPVSVDDLNLFRGSDEAALRRILGSVNPEPGQVVRLNLTAGEGLSIEVIVRNEEGRISLVRAPSAGRALASQDSVGPEPVERARLIDLQTEIGQETTRSR